LIRTNLHLNSHFCGAFCDAIPLSINTAGTGTIHCRHQSMKPQVEVKSMNHRPAGDCTPCRR